MTIPYRLAQSAVPSDTSRLFITDYDFCQGASQS